MPGSPSSMVDRLSPLRARYQSAGLVLFGLFGLFIALRYFMGDAAGLVFTLATGAVLSVASLVRVARQAVSPAGDSDADGSLYPGLLLGAVVGAALLVSGQPADWVLSGLLISVALFAVMMARFEDSAMGLSVALSLAILAAFVGAAQFSVWVSWTFLSMSIMLLAAGLAVSSQRRAGT